MHKYRLRSDQPTPVCGLIAIFIVGEGINENIKSSENSNAIRTPPLY